MLWACIPFLRRIGAPFPIHRYNQPKNGFLENRMHYKLAFIGFGNVGRNLAELLLRKQTELEKDYDITFSVTAIGTGAHGRAVDPVGLDLPRVLETLKAGESLRQFNKKKVANSLELLRKSEAEVLFE